MHVGNLDIPEQVFLDADYFNDHTPGAEGAKWAQSVLGLAKEVVKARDSTLWERSPFQNANLSRGIFTLTLPRSQHDLGLLTIGESHVNTADAKVIPLVQNNKKKKRGLWDSPKESGGWEVSAHSASFASGKGNLTVDLSQHRIILSTVDPLMFLPSSFVHAIFEELGTDYDFEFPCSKRHNSNLPNLTFYFKGPGDAPVEIVLTPEDYLVRMPFFELWSEYPDQCFIIIGPANENEEVDLGEDVLIIGSAFLSRFHVVFDAGKGQIEVLEREDKVDGNDFRDCEELYGS